MAARRLRWLWGSAPLWGPTARVSSARSSAVPLQELGTCWCCGSFPESRTDEPPDEADGMLNDGWNVDLCILLLLTLVTYPIPFFGGDKKLNITQPRLAPISADVRRHSNDKRTCTLLTVSATYVTSHYLMLHYITSHHMTSYCINSRYAYIYIHT